MNFIFFTRIVASKGARGLAGFMFMKDISLVPKTVAQLIKVRNNSNNGWKS